MGKNRSRQRRDELREEAEARREYRASISNQQQMDRLDERLGEGLGASKERVRLWHLVEEEEAEKRRAERRGGKKKKILSGQVKEPVKCAIKFYSADCHLCQELKPIYDIMSDEFPDINFFAFNVSDYPEVEKILGFQGVPTLCGIQCGSELPKRHFIKEPVDPDQKTWYTGNNIRNFLKEF